MVTDLLKLPEAIIIPKGKVERGSIRYTGYNLDFQLHIFKNSRHDLRLCYQLMNYDFFCNRYYGRRWCGFLWLVEGIASDRLLREAITDTRHFLISNKLS